MLTEVGGPQDSFFQNIDDGKGDVQDHVTAIDQD